MLWILVVLPAVCGLGCFFVSPDRYRRTLAVVTGVAHLTLAVTLWSRQDSSFNIHPEDWLALDSLSLLFLLITDILFILAAIYSFDYLAEDHPIHEGYGAGGRPNSHGRLRSLFSQEELFTSMLLLFLAAMSLGILSQHAIVTWVAVEATTLATASLICYHRSGRSLEAAWKYLLICSVGIALAMAGNIALAVAAAFAVPGLDLTYANIMAHAEMLQPLWLKLGFILLLVGYGTKIGFFPMHTWLPDAHSEAPAPVSALLSGTLLNCALLALLRVFAVMNRAGMSEFAGQMLVAFGFLSAAAAAVFLARQRDFKRLLAYSSIEHMGLITLGMGCGVFAREAAALHTLNHSLAKGMLFLTAGNILSLYGTKTIAKVRGLFTSYPSLGVIWIIGLLAICGFPPFGLFVSEFWLFKSLAAAGRWELLGALLLLLGIIFIGMSRSFIRMLAGVPAGSEEIPGFSKPSAGKQLSFLRILPPWLLAAGSLFFGVCLPEPLRALLRDAARIISGA